MERWDLLFAVLMALAAAAPLWGAGMVETRGGGDSPFLLWRMVEMADALRHALFPVRWMADAACGLGYPFFNYYAALPYDLGGGLMVLGVPVLVAIQAVQTLGFLLAALGFALWARRHFASSWAVRVATAAYTFAPFHLVNVYVRGDSLSEFFAFVWYPLILWTLDRLAERPSARRAVAAALAYAALVLTHNVSALIFTPFALGYALLLILAAGAGWGRPARWMAAAFLLGLLLSAWFWLPALAEVRYGQLGEAFTAGYFHYDRHFRGWDLVQQGVAFDYAVAGSVDEAGPFAMGLVQALAALLGAVAMLFHRKGRRQERLFLLGGGALATVMITPLSAPLWAHLGLLAKTQFPWRFLSVQALFAAALAGMLMESEGSKAGEEAAPGTGSSGRWGPISLVRAGAALALIAATMGSALWSLHPARLFIEDGEVTRERLLFYESLTANIGTTIRYEYLPRAVVPRLYISEVVVDGTGALRAEGEEVEGRLLSATPREQRWEVSLAEAARVAFPLNGWPGWVAEVDGRRVAWEPMVGSGRLTLPLGAGRHEVRLVLHETPLRLLADLLSLLATLGVAFWLRRTGGRWSPAGTVRGGAALLLLSLGLPWVLHLVAPLPPAATLFDFVRSPWPHHGVADFGALRAEIAPMEVVAAPGERLTVPLRHLEAAEGLTVTLRLVSPAEPRHGVEDALAVHRFPADAPASAWWLRLPADAPRGLYLVNLRVEGAEGRLVARSAQGEPLGDLYVGMVRVVEGPPAPGGEPLARFPDLVLHAVEGVQDSPQSLAVHLTWSAPTGMPRNWSLSLRLHDVEGRTIAQWDGQPGYGYLPTTMWRPGEAVSHTVRLALPYGTAPGRYDLEVITYLEATMSDGASATFPLTLTQVSLWNSREEHCPLVRKGLTLRCPAGDLFLKKVEMPERVVEGEPLEFVAEWTAIATPQRDVLARWEVVDGEGAAVVSVEGPLAPGSDTRLWPRFALVRAPVRLDLPPLLDRPPYHLVLTVLDGEERYRCEMEEPLPIERRPRSFEMPHPAHPMEATFGGTIRILGYDLAREGTAWHLTLWWQALRQPAQDYKRFVHLYDAGGAVLAQSDAMPRDWSYPTSWWAAGEVVSETVVLEAAAGGTTFGVGWYDPQSLERLPAVDAAGNPLPGDVVRFAAAP